MEVDEKIKKKIIDKKIILEKDWDRLNDDMLQLAVKILEFTDNQPEDDCLSAEERSEFFEEFTEIQDKMELEQCDIVKENKEKDFESFSIKIPANFARYIREKIFPKMRENLKIN